MTDPNRLIDAYLDGDLSPEELSQLEQDLASNAEYADAFASVMMINELLGERFHRDAITTRMQKDDGSFLGDQDLKALQNDYDHAMADLVTIVDIPDDQPSFSETVLTVGFEIKRLVCTKPAPFILSGIAALLLFAVWVINPFAGHGPQAPVQEVAEPPIHHDSRVVANLTAAHDARWASTVLREGDRLYANQVLTLNEGLAQITTVAGAKLILQAPCEVELLDNDNALRLHRGKLVGVCETESSKGLLVRTPHMDVIDLGTQFGIDASRFDASIVDVFQGEVSVASPTTEGSRQPVLLKADQAVAVDRTGEVQRVEPDPLAFVQADEFDAIVRADVSPAHRWQAYTAQLRRDSDLLALYLFDGDNDQAVANNTAAPGGQRFHARRGDGRDHTSPTRSADRFGRAGHAMAFDRREMQAFYVPDWHEAGPLDALTVSCWFKLEDHAGDWPLLVTHWHDAHDAQNASSAYAFHLGVHNAARNPNLPGQRMGLQAHVSHTGGRNSKLGWDVKHEARDGGSTSPGDGWVHAALTIQCGGGPIRLYKNGVEIDTHGATYEPAQLPNPKHPLAIGGKSTYRGVDRGDIVDPVFSGFFQGQIDDVALIGRALTQDEIQDLYRAGVAEPD